MATTGSNAPFIVNPLAAWPPPPQRFASPPVTLRGAQAAQLSSFAIEQPVPALPGYQLSRLTTSQLEASSSNDSGSSTPRSPRDYPPPKSPLSPVQLGRIAQSFGIVVPKVSKGASSPASRRPTSPESSTPPPLSHNVVTVIPPTCMLAPTPGSDETAERDRRRRWRRGRLIPLQPTWNGMLAAIVREFGLPSTLGITVHLNETGTKQRRASISSDDDMGGPEITPSAWNAFVAHATRKAASPINTPIHTPRKQASAAMFGAIMTPTPAEKPARFKSLSQSSGTSSASASSVSPYTPASGGELASMPTCGTIEFDIDLEQARWFDSWMEAGGGTRRFPPSAEIAGVRELRLVERLNDPRPKFLRQMEEERERAERLAAERAAAEVLEQARLAAEKEEAEREAERLRLEVEAAERAAASLRISRKEVERQAQIAGEREQEEERMAQLASATEGEGQRGLFRDEDGGQRSLSQALESLGDLASPIPLTDPSSSPTTPRDPNDYRGSGILMADQLSTLEKMVRDLSPKDMSFNSSDMRAAQLDTMSAMKDLPSRSSSILPYLSGGGPGSRGSHVPSPLSLAPTAGWPTVPFKRSDHTQAESPLQEFFSRPTNGLPPVAEQADRPMSDASDYGAPPAMSPTTHRKVESTDDALQSPQLFGPGLGHGRKPSNPPQRPARPPTPDLSMPESIPRTLAPEFVEAIKSPTASHGFSGARPPSMSFRGLRRQSMNKSRPRTRVNPHPREESSTSYSSYTSTSTRGESLGSTDDAAHVYHPFPHDEFGMDDDHVHPSAHSHGSASRKEHRLTSRLFSFGRKSRHEDERPPTIMHISGPIPTSFQHLSPTDLAASGLSTPTSATATPTSATVPPVPSIPSVRGLAPPAMLAPASLFTHSNNSGSTLGPNDVQGSNPNSPTSPHHVRRKPVPGMEGQRDSAYSVGSAKQA